MDPQSSSLGDTHSSSSPRHSPPPSNQAPKPRGILKNPLDRRPSGAEETSSSSSELSSAAPAGLRVDTNGINWDEANIALHDFEKESTQRMKIDEPKTPFVRGSGSALDDEAGFDAFNLDASMSESPRSNAAGDASRLAANTSANAQLGHAAPPPSGRAGSTSAVGLDAADLAGVSASSASATASSGPRRPSLASRSSRSPSFSLPASGSSSRRASNRSNSGLAGAADSRSGVRADASAMDIDGSTEHAIGVDDEEDEDDEETRAQKAAFAQKRNAHYGNEAEALKVAKALAAQEDEEDEEGEGGDAVPPVPRVPNGA